VLLVVADNAAADTAARDFGHAVHYRVVNDYMMNALVGMVWSRKRACMIHISAGWRCRIR